MRGGQTVLRIAHSIEVARPPATVFSWLAQRDKLRQWESRYLGSERPAANHFGPGERSREVFAVGVSRVIVDVDVLRHEPPRHLVASVAGPGFRAVSAYHLEEADGGTRLVAEADHEYLGRIASLAGRLAIRRGQRRLERDLTRLRRILESEDPERSEFRLGDSSRRRLWVNRALGLLVALAVGAAAGFADVALLIALPLAVGAGAGFAFASGLSSA